MPQPHAQPARSDCGLPAGASSPWSLGRGLVSKFPCWSPCLAVLQARDDRHQSVSQPGLFGDAIGRTPHTKGPGKFGRCWVRPVKPASRKTECSLPVEMGIWEWGIRREKKAFWGRHKGSSSGSSGLAEKTPMGRPQCGSQSREKNCPLQNTCTLLGDSAAPPPTLPILDTVFLSPHDRGRS